MSDDARQWPPRFYDLVGGGVHDWDDVVPLDEAEVDDGSPPITYRDLAYEIADAYGGLDDLLDRMWLRAGGR